MSFQIRKASQELNKISLLVAELVSQSSKLPVNDPIKQSVNILISSINSDKAIQAFIEKINFPGMEIFLNELAIRVVTKAQNYQVQLRKLINEVSLTNAKIQNARTTGLGWSFTDLFSSGDASGDRDSGLSLLRAYFNTAKLFSSFGYPSFDAFITYAESKVPNFATNVGELVRMNKYSTTESEAQNRLTDLANKSQGKASLSQIIGAAGGTGDTVNWTAVVPDVAVEVGQNVVTTGSEILQNVGTGVVSTLNLVKYLPWILGGVGIVAALYYANKLKVFNGKK